MKITLRWLKQYVDFDGSPAELAERLTLLGLEVEGIHPVAGEFDGIVVAQILSVEKVPGSDKLTVCKVNDGQRERTIICGAQNHKPGDKVPLILPNFALPSKPGQKEPFVIRERKVFGITSQGMMCSAQELGLEPEKIGLKNEDGLLILPPDAPVGQPFAEFLGRPGSDVVLDLEITPNRPDWNGVIGIARELAAATGQPLKLPEIKLSESEETIAGLVAVKIEDAGLCPRYTARVVKGVKIGPSPDWLRATLEKVGLRSINNVVDVTNYVMLECGQPLHAFDFHLLAPGAEGRPTLVVRRAREGETFITLDGVERTLTGDMLLIADAQKGIALAGIMGGANTEIHDRTSDVLIESAYFSPTNIRRTSKALGLRSESSYRFERGADIGICDWASRRAAQLILQTAGGQLAAGVVDIYPQPAEPKQITLRHHKVAELLGIELKPEECEFYLGQLGLKPLRRKARPVDAGGPPEPATFQIPTWRPDLKREVDLIEEIARLHGVDKIPATPPRGAIGFTEFDAIYDQLSEARNFLTALGLNEAQGQTLIAKAEIRPSNPKAVMALANPLSSDMDALRPSLLPGLIHSLRHNVSRRNADVALFEIERVFSWENGAAREERRLAIALTSRRAPIFWSGAEREARFDVFDLKGIVEEFLEHFGVRGVSFARCQEKSEWFVESATLALGGKVPLGELGQLHPALARKYDLREAVFLAELNLDQLLVRRNPAKSFKPLPQFPAIRRDVAMLLPENVTHETVLQIVRQTKPAHLERVELFDVFRGPAIPAGQKSLAYAFIYRSPERTLTDAEVNAAHAQVVEAFKTKLQATVRE